MLLIAFFHLFKFIKNTQRRWKKRQFKFVRRMLKRCKKAVQISGKDVRDITNISMPAQGWEKAKSSLYTKSAISRLALYVLSRTHYAASLAGINSQCFRRWGTVWEREYSQEYVATLAQYLLSEKVMWIFNRIYCRVLRYKYRVGNWANWVITFFHLAFVH